MPNQSAGVSLKAVPPKFEEKTKPVILEKPPAIIALGTVSQ